MLFTTVYHFFALACINLHDSVSLVMHLHEHLIMIDCMFSDFIMMKIQASLYVVDQFIIVINTVSNIIYVRLTCISKYDRDAIRGREHNY